MKFEARVRGGREERPEKGGGRFCGGKVLQSRQIENDSKRINLFYKEAENCSGEILVLN